MSRFLLAEDAAAIKAEVRRRLAARLTAAAVERMKRARAGDVDAWSDWPEIVDAAIAEVELELVSLAYAAGFEGGIQ